MPRPSPVAQEYDIICNPTEIFAYADKRGWCWRRGQIAATMGSNEYIVKLSQELSSLVLPADSPPPCFENVFYDP